MTTPYFSTTDFSGEVLLMKRTRLWHTASLRSTYTITTLKSSSTLLILSSFHFAHPADQGEESPVWFCDAKCVLGVCGLPTRMVFCAEGL